MERTLEVEAGALVLLRLFDVAYEIDLARVEDILGARPEAAVGRLRLPQTDPKAIALRDPPVEIALGPVRLPHPHGELTAEGVARVYDFGVISIALRHPVARLPWEEFVDRAVELAREPNGGTPVTCAQLLERVCSWIQPALDRPNRSGIEEDYLFSIVERFDRPVRAEELSGEVDLIPLLTGDRRELSGAARRDILKHSFSYYKDDLAVVTWDQAFLLEPSGDSGVADVLEVANAQLLELRYYDGVLDRELPRMYERVAAVRKGVVLRRGRYARIARELHILVAEVTEITERIDNAIKVTEDVYLGRVYAAAVELFRVPAWAGAVDRKLDIIRQTYSALHEEANAGRAELLELAIVLLIVLEIVLAFLL
jgi:hypothetical protein